MLYAIAACATLIFVLTLAVPHAAKAHRLRARKRLIVTLSCSV